MRFGLQLNIIAIPEWRQCYLNYEILKIFVMLIKQIVQAICQCEDLMKQLTDSQGNPLNFDNHNISIQVSQLNNLHQDLMEKLNHENQLFYSIYIIQAEITELFYQMKVIQIEQRFEMCSRLLNKQIKKELLPIFLTYIQYAYIQISYISEMRQANLEAERKILKKHKKYAKKRIQTPSPSHEKINRMASIQQDYINKIEDLYVEANKQMVSKDAREFIREAAFKDQIKYSDYFLFGLGVGATVVLMVTLIFIILYQNLNVENSNAAFSRDFPTWRGTALFVLYIWVLGFDVYCFEKYKISHRLIFQFNDHHYSSSSYLFKMAGFFTALYMVAFLIYLLLITNIIKPVESFRNQYIVLTIWLGLGAFLLIPLPIFNHEGRLYALKLFLKCLISPLFGVDFTIVWMTDQWISMATPLRDMAYTVCYYTRLNFDIISVNPCKSNSSFEVVVLVVVIAISFRIMQCIRMGYQQGKFFMTPHMGNTLKYCASLLTAILSFVYNQGYPNLLVVWIISSIVSTIYSYVWDLKYDFLLLQPNCKNWLLRKYLTFEPKRNYYIVILMNFIMRLSWTMTISPAVASYFGNSSLLTFVTGAIEIIRRGIWNLFRVERQHLQNCNEFKAIPDMKNIERQLQSQGSATQIQEIRGMEKPEQIRESIKKSYIALIKRKIQHRELKETEYNEEYQVRKTNQIKQIKLKIGELEKSLKKQV